MKETIKQLRDDIEAEITAGATTEELLTFMSSYAFGPAELFEVIRVLLAENQNSRELLNDGR